MTTQTVFTFTSEDVRQYCLEQLEKDSKDYDYLTLEEHRWMLSTLLQVEQVTTLQKLCEELQRCATAIELLERR
jgi:hypothetical protein